MSSVIAPPVICIYRGEHLPTTMEFFEKIDDYLQSREPVTIDFSNCSEITAAAAVITFAKITRFQLAADYFKMKAGHQAIKIILPADREVRNFFRESGFYDAIRPGGMSKLERLLHDINNPFKTSNATEADIQAVIKHLRNRLGTLPGRLISALSEAYLNIGHHAYDHDIIEELQGRWWQYTSSIKSDGTFSVIIYDTGKGIPKSLGRKYTDEGNRYSHIENLVIEYAMIRGNSRYPKNLGRGNGFSNIKQPVDVNKEAKHLLIASGKGSVTYKNQQIIKSEMLTNHTYGGTLIEWCFDGDMK